MTKVFNFPYEGTPRWYQDTWQEMIEVMVGYKNGLSTIEREVFGQIHEHLKLRYMRSPYCYKEAAYRDLSAIKGLGGADIYHYMQISMKTFIEYHAYILHQDEKICVDRGK